MFGFDLKNLTLWPLIGFFSLASSVHVQGQLISSDSAVRVSYKQGSYVGRPLAWDGKELMLLRRDGNISILPVKSEKDYSRVGGGFVPYSRTQLKKRLEREFGSKYQVSVTTNFVVVHPPGDYRVWAMPFEELFLRFKVYFSKRGFVFRKTEFPMVAVVLRTRGEFDRFLHAYHQYDSKILGYYSPRSNRIITFDQSGGTSNSQAWFFNTNTIVHEATHQTAFNLGVHSRYAPVVRWGSEGLAMMFEADGVNNSVAYPNGVDRINRNRLDSLKRFYMAGQVKGQLRQLVLNDDLFRTNPELAYALSWGMTFYFSEKMTTEYHEFLSADSQRTEFLAYPAKQRASDFVAAFGNDWQGLEARMKRFFEALDVP